MRRSATKQQLQSLIGLLIHAATVVRQGRTFLWGLIEAMSAPGGWTSVPALTSCVVWILCSGVPLSSSGSDCPLIDTVYSDASGSWRCGSYTQSGTYVWLQAKWFPTWVEVSIAVKELLPIVLTAVVWGRRWRLVGCCSTLTIRLWLRLTLHG